MPEAWARNLEKAGSIEKVFSDANIAAHNYIVEHNTAGWPIGFVVDKQTSSDKLAGARLTYPAMAAHGELTKPWLGLNCSACHTNQVTYTDPKTNEAHSLRVDGAPTAGDFQGLFEDMLAGLKDTAADKAKFDRFAQAVTGGVPTQAQSDDVRSELTELVAWEDGLADRNATPLRYGSGRLDAQGHILNKIEMLAILAKHPQPAPLAPTPADAPASYPFIWDAPIEDLVQYNGIVANSPEYTINKRPTNIGALGRNIGEVIGVFAQVDTVKPTSWGGYNSTAQVSDLIDLERRLGGLDSPSWPTWLGVPDDGRKILGAKIYWGLTEGTRDYSKMPMGNCASCHNNRTVDGKDGNKLDAHGKYTAVKVMMQPLREAKTDIWLACNTYYNQANTVWFKDRPTLPFSTTPFGPQAKVAQMLEHTVVASIVADAKDLADKAWNDALGHSYVVPPPQRQGALRIEYLPGISDPARKKQAEDCINKDDDKALDAKLAYKARPLDGIWATAPYLHNGSVPTLYDLLLPATVKNASNDHPPAPVQCDRDKDGVDKPCTRPEDFWVGSHEFDPRLVGFVSTSGAFEFKVRGSDGTPILGNYNSGHYYGTDLNDRERWALVEYLKTL
jgi:mono/diheme cytochrome c family protein